jgi:anaerobic selenocysteine-containing dehydrogenase
MCAYADLVLPDTTYLERYDAMSLLDRPISEFDGPCDSVRVPVVPPKGDCKPFQDVVVELASRLKFPAFTAADGSRKFKDYKDFVINFQTAPDSGVGFLAGYRGPDGDKALVGEPNPAQWEMYEKNNCVFHYEMPQHIQYMRNWNHEYMLWAQANGLRRDSDPIQIHLYSEVLQRFRRAAQGKGGGRRPPPRLREANERTVDAAEDAFSGFVFKIQANMDPRHRDRIFFLRIVSGTFQRDMQVINTRTGQKVRLANSQRLFGRDRETVDEAFAGDVVGIVGPRQAEAHHPVAQDINAVPFWRTRPGEGFQGG